MTVFSIEPLHGFEGKYGGAVSGSEDVCHKAHDHHGQRLAVFFFGKEKSKDGPEGLCSMIYEPGLFCDLHQTAPDGHDSCQG